MPKWNRSQFLEFVRALVGEKLSQQVPRWRIDDDRRLLSCLLRLQYLEEQNKDEALLNHP